MSNKGEIILYQDEDDARQIAEAKKLSEGKSLASGE